jgi:uncharacterized pyridoxamine 5'-phosphate oxidase family protein
MEDMKKVYAFLDKAGVFFLATEDGEQAKCRPLGFKMMENFTIYFGIGTHKNVYNQLQRNANCEICACVKDKFLRFYGEAVFDTAPEFEQKALNVMPDLKRIYNGDTGLKMGVFHLENGKAEFCNVKGQVEESLSF